MAKAATISTSPLVLDSSKISKPDDRLRSIHETCPVSCRKTHRVKEFAGRKISSDLTRIIGFL